MKSFKVFLLCSVFMSTITNCASQKFEKEAPVDIVSIYKQHWTSGVKGGGSGTNIFVELESERPKDISFDSIYFETFQLPLKQDSHNALLFAGRKVNAGNKKYTLPTSFVVTSDASIEPTEQKPKFQLENNECVIRYTISGKVKYFKYDTLQTKSAPLIPHARPKG
ncbi:hypothetical protein [Formosa sp. PL04]|uniref:hypothetical protein n=1 Tax=Formosa sp. PL04 TaxID=3081755 RepID=UPI0029825618|nr:hypothetical protein [Formosa sp. PL04]MDW5289033.1 hypothetical protein [Formosa sp. PL04]